MHKDTRTLTWPAGSYTCTYPPVLLTQRSLSILLVTSVRSPPVLWPYVPAVGKWSPAPRWCSQCSAWCLLGSGCTSPTHDDKDQKATIRKRYRMVYGQNKEHLNNLQKLSHLKWQTATLYFLASNKQGFQTLKKPGNASYLFINKLQLKGIGFRIHVNGHITAKTSRFILHQYWAT